MLALCEINLSGVIGSEGIARYRKPSPAWVIGIVSPCGRHLRWIRDQPQRQPGMWTNNSGVSLDLENEKILPFRPSPR
jgi:hypothetical protein